MKKWGKKCFFPPSNLDFFSEEKKQIRICFFLFEKEKIGFAFFLRKKGEKKDHITYG